MKNQLLNNLEMKQFIRESQYRFRNNLGIENALIYLSNILFSKCDIKNKILISFSIWKRHLILLVGKFYCKS